MTEFEFIEAISEGNLAKNDVIKYAEGVCDKRDLLENIFAYIVSLNTINDEIILCVNDHSFDNTSEIKVKHGNQYLEKQDRLYQAINYIETSFSISLFDNDGKIKMDIEKLNTDRAKEIFGRIKYCRQEGYLYKWTGTTALFGYMVDIVSDKLGIRPSNNRIPWRYFKSVFQMSDRDIGTAKQAVNDYSQKELPKPEGYEDIVKACE